MKCRICGNSFDGNGDICEECLENIKYEEENNSDPNQVLLEFKRKHLIKYELLKYYFIYIVFLLTGALARQNKCYDFVYNRNAYSYRIFIILEQKNFKSICMQNI